jgi:membrane protease YdiL (CAAX protease family)
MIQRSKIIVAVSWIFIIATIIFSQSPVYRALKLPPPDSAADLQAQLAGKYIVGIKHLIGQHPALKGRIAQLGKDLQKNQDRNTRLTYIPILAELSGREAAMAELKRLAENPTNAGTARDLQIFLRLYGDGDASLDSQQRIVLKRYRWIGELALSQDKPDSDPARKAVLRSAFRMVFLLVALMLVIFMAVFAGLILLTIAIILRARGHLPGRLVMPENPGNLLLESFAIYMTGFMALPALILMFWPDFRVGAIALSVFAVILAILWPCLQGSDWRSFRESLGWHCGRGFWREAGAGILGYIAGLPLLLGAAVFVLLLARHVGKIPVHPMVNEFGRGPLQMVIWGFLACVWAPVVEETFFRGALFGYFRRYLPWAPSGILTGTIFAIIHPQGWIAVPALAVIGFNLSAIREWRGSIVASMSAHALNNGAALLLLIIILS